MTKKISEIYTEYKIMPNLQEHMFRVAAVASLICDNFSEPLMKNDIITACLLHDMGNIIKSDLEYLPHFNEPKGIKYWEEIKNEYIKKYGKDDHTANVKIVKELGFSNNITKIVDEIHFPNIAKHFKGDDFNIKVVTYADYRVDPHGVVSYDERMDEAKERYKNRQDLFPVKQREELIAYGKEIEKQIFLKCKIKPEDINNETVAPIISKLRNFVVK